MSDDSIEVAGSTVGFKKSFKYFKSNKVTPDFNRVIDFDNFDHRNNVKSIKPTKNIQNIPKGLIDIVKWKCYKLSNGLIFIRNPFTPCGQRYWISKCLRDYPKSPNVVNLNSKMFEQKVIDDWWSSLQNSDDSVFRKKLKIAMRWTTLGYHHDWDTKVYTETAKNDFPTDLAQLCQFFAHVFDFDDFSAEAAIVNYYPIGTTLAGHTDHSENDLEAPLFSFSFGQTAIFLIGGKELEQTPDAIFLKSGDIVIMTKSSRLCYHAVPRVMKTDKETWNKFDGNGKDDEKDTPCKIKKFDNDFKNVHLDSMDKILWENCELERFWLPFRDYLKDSRININIRQVLKKGQTSL